MKIFILLLLALLNFNLVAHKKNNLPIIFETPHRFHPEIGEHGAVATQESHATQIGINILKNGGNAIDAAVAIGYALAVTLPRAGNIGGGGFMTIWLNKEQKAYIINYRERAPSNQLINQVNKLPYEKFIYSYKAAGVPGTVAGLNLANLKFGKLPLNPADLYIHLVAS